MSLRARFAPVDGMGLAELQQRYSEVITKQPYACPDIWVNDLEYFSLQMAEAGGTKKSSADIIAHLITSVPRIYDPVITLVTSKPITTSGLLAETQVLMRNYWVRNIKNKYATTPATSNKKHHEAYAYNTTPENPPSAMSAQRPWRKFKGMCKHCGKQGHRIENCYAKQREEGKTPDETGNEKRKFGIKCYTCNKIGHISRECPESRKMNNQNTQFVGHFEVEDNFFDNFTNNGSDDEVDDKPTHINEYENLWCADDDDNYDTKPPAIDFKAINEP